MEGEFQYAKQTRSTSWITTYNSFTDVEEELFFFFCMLRIEGEIHYKRGINILLLLHSQSGRGVSLENPCPPWYNSLHLQKSQKYSSFSTFSQWKGKFSFLTQSWIPNYNSLTDVEEKLFFFFCMLRMEGELHYTREINILLLLHSQSGRGDSLENLCPPRY